MDHGSFSRGSSFGLGLGQDKLSARGQSLAKSTIWEQAFEQFRNDLEENDDLRSVLDEGTMESLVMYAESTSSTAMARTRTTRHMHRLSPIIRFIDDFAAVLAYYFGADPGATALVWGSIRLMLSLCPNTQDTLQQILDMLEDISLTLPRFRQYEQTLPLDRPFKTALLEVYTEMICFCARTIHFLRLHPHAILQNNAWDDRRSDFERTIKRVKRMSSQVEHEADLARMRADNKYDEVLEIVKDLQQTKVDGDRTRRYTYLPRALGKFFCGRRQDIEAIQNAFNGTAALSPIGPQVCALHGMGGVGKTQIALGFVNTYRRDYDDVFWIAAESMDSVSQSCFDLIMDTGMLRDQSEEVKNVQQALLWFRSWLGKTTSKWLLVLDNVEAVDVVIHLLPKAEEGSVLFTTRDFNLARDLATHSINVRTFDADVAATMLLHIVGLKSEGKPANLETALSISEALGGLPLAIAQMGSFIAQRKLAISEFLPLYKRNAAKVDSRKVGTIDYEHTLSTVWQISLDRLEGNSKTLQELLAFLNPDGVRTLVLSEGSRNCDDAGLDFLHDELDFGDAQEPLLQLALIEKNEQSGVLGVHRLVQAAVMRMLTDGERSRLFSAVTRILCWGFPDHWSKDQGHQVATWSRCEMCLPHVQHLVKVLHTYHVPLMNADSYAELLLRCGWYLYEREAYFAAKPLLASALSHFSSKSTTAYASAVDLTGLISMDLAQPREAMARFEEALQIRESLLNADDPFIAFSLNNLALAYTELGGSHLPQALEAHERAIKIRLAHAPDRIGNSYSNLASLQLRMDKPDDAERTLASCPSLRDFTDETFLATGNPRFSGDMVLLSRIRVAQGRTDEALRLASKALIFRRQLLGAKLKACDSLYDVAGLLIRSDRTATAAELLKESIDIAQALPEGEGQLARALWRLSRLNNDAGRVQEAASLCQQAREVREKVQSLRASSEADEDTAFESLCPWMLW